MNVHNPRARRGRPAVRTTFVLVATLGTAATLAAVVYLASTSLPYLATSPTADPLFGEHNQCLLDSLGEPRVGFAVSPDGRHAASYGGASLALCERPPEGGRAFARKLSLAGITAAAFDFEGTLWVATGREGEGPAALWHLPARGDPVRVGDLSPIALAGHALGVAALDGAGRLVSLSADGKALGFAQLPGVPSGGVHLAANADGTLLGVVAGTGLFVYRTDDLTLVRAEGPCKVEFLWWESKEPSRALVACAPGRSWVLALEAHSGQKEAAPKRERVESLLVQRLGAYVHGCEQLPCSAPAP